MTVNARTITDNEYFYGHKACAGCAGSLVVRQAWGPARFAHCRPAA